MGAKVGIILVLGKYKFVKSLYLPDAEYADERRVTQILLIISKISLRSSAYSA